MARVEPESEPEPIPKEEFEACLASGVSLFNEGEYMEAHETFERAWVSTHDSEADFFKGLIQCSICLYHFSRGNPDGAKKLYSGQRRLLSSFLPTHRGIDVEAFMTAMQDTLRPVLRARGEDAPEFSMEKRPRIERI